MGMINDDALLRLESNELKHLIKMAFEVLGEVKLAKQWENNAQTTAAEPLQ